MLIQYSQYLPTKKPIGNVTSYFLVGKNGFINVSSENPKKEKILN